MKPSLGRIVRYIGKEGAHSPRAAIVTCAQADVQPDTDLAPLDTAMHVYLWVFTPGSAGFVETNIPYDENGAPGTWSWPPILLRRNW